MTKAVIECLRRQNLDEALEIFITDDGSTDGTSAFLAQQADITTLRGDGTLWWGGAIEKGLQAILPRCAPTDHVLFLNNDTMFAPNFVQGLLNLARANKPAAVGSVICDEDAPDTVISIGPVLDTWRLKIRDKLAERRPRITGQPVHSVDALSGRGTLYPVAAFQAAGTMNLKWLPHYLADYELAVRVRRHGFVLIVSEDAVILSADDYGNARRAPSLMQKYFSVRSAYYLPAVLRFWWTASPGLFGKLTIVPRLFYTQIAHIRKPL